MRKFLQFFTRPLVRFIHSRSFVMSFAPLSMFLGIIVMWLGFTLALPNINFSSYVNALMSFFISVPDDPFHSYLPSFSEVVLGMAIIFPFWIVAGCWTTRMMLLNGWQLPKAEWHVDQFIGAAAMFFGIIPYVSKFLQRDLWFIDASILSLIALTGFCVFAFARDFDPLPRNIKYMGRPEGKPAQ